MKSTHFSTAFFDWGNTVMMDDPTSTIPMVEWDTIEVVQGIQLVLEYLLKSGRHIVLATSASISTEAQIYGALARGGLDQYFSRIFCFGNTGLPKGEEFYRFILGQLDLHASDALMVGDSFEKDVLDANKVGVYAIWFNPKSVEVKRSSLHVTVHKMQDLLAYFKLLNS